MFEEGALPFRADISGQDDRDITDADVEHDRVLVADPLSFPIRQRRMQNTYSHRSDTLLVTRLHGSPAQANCIGGVV